MMTNHLKRIIVIITTLVVITTFVPKQYPAQIISKHAFLLPYSQTDLSNHITNLTENQQVLLTQLTNNLHNEIKKSISPEQSKQIIAEKLRQIYQHNIITQNQYNYKDALWGEKRLFTHSS